MTPDERINLIRAYQKAFLSPEGANVLADLSRVCFEKRTTFFGDSERMSSFMEGKRAVMLYIRRLVEAKPEEPEPAKALTEEDGNA